MNLSEVTVFIHGEEKEEALTAMKRVKRHGKNAALLHSRRVASVSKSAFIYFQCNADQKINYILL